MKKEKKEKNSITDQNLFNTKKIDFNRLGPSNDSKIIIIGGCGGIGRKLVDVCSNINLRIGVLDLKESLDKKPPPHKCFQYAVDATNEKEVIQAYNSINEEFGGVDIIVNLSGYINESTNVKEINEKSWELIINNNLKSTYLCSKHAIPLLENSEKACIINTSSSLAFKGFKGNASYGAAKAGIIAFSKSLASELAPKIRVNVIAPGAVDTNFLYGRNRMIANKNLTNNPMKRLACVEDIIGPILFLSGDASKYITGQVIHINGGSLMP